MSYIDDLAHHYERMGLAFKLLREARELIEHALRQELKTGASLSIWIDHYHKAGFADYPAVSIPDKFSDASASTPAVEVQ